MFICGDGEVRSQIISCRNYRDPDSATSTRFARLVYRLRLSHLPLLSIPVLTETCSVRTVVAEMEGFEPSRAFRPYLVSSEALSTTQPHLQVSLHYHIFFIKKRTLTRPLYYFRTEIISYPAREFEQ